jgi:cytochrome b
MNSPAEGVAQVADADGTASWRVWDAPTRAMHWLLVVFIAICWWTGVHNQLDYHLYGGYAVLWIVLLRIYWGVVGSSTARFVHFVRGPAAILDYARSLPRRDTPHVHGHNPLGAISVLVMLGLVLAIVTLGLFAVDVDGLYSGPLSSYVSFKEGRHLAHLHYRIFDFTLWVIVLHILAVIFYYVYKRHNLVFPMITGRRRGEAGELHIAPVWRLAVGAIIATAIVWLITTGFYF